MGSAPFHQKPSFRAVALAVVLAAVWLYYVLTQGGIRANLAGILFDVLLLLVACLVSLFVYSQFVLPVRSLQDRARVFGRLLLHLRGAAGPTIFVENGRKIERPGESNKRGPGLIWIDSASAATTRTTQGMKRVLGPGIHFTDADEEIAGTFSLHLQTCSMGPSPDDPIFEKPAEDAPAQERQRHAALQAKRMAVSGRSRDGNEVVPEIHVVFKLDAKPANPGMPGSRFGFMSEAVEKAARGEGVGPASGPDRQYHVAWNQLPGLIAADLWREFLGKFTLDELFMQTFPGLPDILQPEEPAPPIPLQAPLGIRHNFPARILRRFNNSLEAWLGARGIHEDVLAEEQYAQRSGPVRRHRPSQTYTALQIIVQMMKARMMQAEVPALDECGRVLKGHVPSEEYRRLKERGVFVVDLSIRGLRFDPTVEEQIVQQWNTAWMANATSDLRRVEQLELLAGQAGQQRALLDHAAILGRAISAEEPKTVSAAVKALLLATQNEILTDENLYGRGASEVEALTQLLKWAESTEYD